MHFKSKVRWEEDKVEIDELESSGWQFFILVLLIVEWRTQGHGTTMFYCYGPSISFFFFSFSHHSFDELYLFACSIFRFSSVFWSSFFGRHFCIGAFYSHFFIFDKLIFKMYFYSQLLNFKIKKRVKRKGKNRMLMEFKISLCISLWACHKRLLFVVHELHSYSLPPALPYIIKLNLGKQYVSI